MTGNNFNIRILFKTMRKDIPHYYRGGYWFEIQAVRSLRLVETRRGKKTFLPLRYNVDDIRGKDTIVEKEKDGLMGFFDREIDITRNIKIIEWLKGELLTDIARLYKILANGIKEEIHESVSDTISNIILISYLLGRRLGINYNAIENKIKNKIKLGLVEGHDVEKYYGDLSELSRHLDSSRTKKMENWEVCNG